MDIKTAEKIAKQHYKYTETDKFTISYYALSNGLFLHIMTVYEPFYYDDIDNVTYIDIEDENGDCIESHTAKPEQLKTIAYWVKSLCYDTDIIE